jgi:hypothetical protein
VAGDGALDGAERVRVDGGAAGRPLPAVTRGMRDLDIRIVDNLAHPLEKRVRVLIGQESHVEDRRRLGGDHVVAVAAPKDGRVIVLRSSAARSG